MKFTEAVALVLSRTKRPEKAIEAAYQVNRAISYFTYKASFSHDLVETSIPIDANAYGATISISGLTRFRKFKYVKPTAVRGYLHPIGADKLFTPGGVVQYDRYFLAGSNMTYTLSSLVSALDVGYYSYPETLDGTASLNSHWMLDLMAGAIIDRACSFIFDDIGDEITAKKKEASAEDFFQVARADFEDQVVPYSS